MYLCAGLKLSELKLCNEFEVTLKLAVISCRITFSHWVGLDTLPYYSDSQYTCVFVEFKKGVEGTHSIKLK